ncbi:MAG: malto-oligosyltrehalose trehalohydrolase [Phyllobacteriaceae bacterium]|nr:malto-oligosyltrehalose trehalohydrolase [Phyllobacteriaceae bacterium]
MTIELERATSPEADTDLSFPYRFGPKVHNDGSTTFRLWAPSLTRAEVVFEDGKTALMEPAEDGFLSANVPYIAEGTLYQFRAGGQHFPDLASRQQETDAKGWSVVRRPLSPSQNREPLRPWHETIICEVHIGTATPEGTFYGLRDRLEHFRDAGYTCLEIMPINEFPGDRNWGYDGTLIWAPDAAYGTPEDLRALVDRAHELGICMVLDVVNNHFGETDNFVEHYAPEWFNNNVQTPWGPGINFNEPMVRRFYYENAQMWLREYDFDGLRFDSVHEMKTESRDLFLGELAKACREAKSHAKLIIENMDNTAVWLERDAATNTPINFVAQWNDDIHHVLNFLVTKEPKYGYDDLEKALADGYVHDGHVEGRTDGTTRGEPGSLLPPDAFITYVQNHDQIGNRGDNRRLPDRIGAERLDFLHFVAFLAPQIPLFFMGEEAHLRTRFPFFTDLPPGPAKEKADDRDNQMGEIFEEKLPPEGLPYPNDEATFQMATIDWSDYETEIARAALDRFRTLSAWRREHVWPLAATPCHDATCLRIGNALILNWIFEAGTLSMALNPNDEPAKFECEPGPGTVHTGEFSQSGNMLRLTPWTAVSWNTLPT